MPQKEPYKFHRFKLSRIFIMMVLTMVLFNITMDIATEKIWEFLAEGKFLANIGVMVLASVIGLLVPPAFIALLFFGFVMETLYATRSIRYLWLFCIFAGLFGMGLFMLFVYGAGKDFEIKMLIVMFIAHFLSTWILYRDVFKENF